MGRITPKKLFKGKCIPANRPDFIGIVPIIDFQNLQKSGRPDFLEFQPLNIPVFQSNI